MNYFIPKYIFYSLLVFSFFSCGQNSSSKRKKRGSDVVKNGLVKRYDDQHRLVSETTYKDGIRHGITKYYYRSGALSDEINFVDDYKHGIAKKYHKNGNIYSMTPYIGGEKDGIQKKFYANGNLWAETPYRQGQAGIGLKEYKRDGSLRRNFPKIEIQKLLQKDKVILTFFLSNYSKNVIFYVTNLVQEKYIPRKVDPLYASNGSVRYEMPISSFKKDTSINIVAKYQTPDYNIFVTQRKYKVRK